MFQLSAERDRKRSKAMVASFWVLMRVTASSELYVCMEDSLCRSTVDVAFRLLAGLVH
jgi:hypothetical protein